MFPRDISAARCARNCVATLQDVHGMRFQGTTAVSEELQERYEDLTWLLQHRYLDWNQHCGKRGGEDCLMDCMFVTWAHLYCMCNAEMWQRRMPTENQARAVQKQLRMFTRLWHVHPKSDDDAHRLKMEHASLMKNAAHILVTYMSSFVHAENNGPEEEDPTFGVTTSKYADIDQAKDLKNKLSDVELQNDPKVKVAGIERVMRLEEGSDNASSAMDVDTEPEGPHQLLETKRNDFLDTEALCPLRFAELASRAYYIGYFEHTLFKWHNTRWTFLDEGHAWLADIDTTLNYLKNCTKKTPTETSENEAKHMLCMWHTPLGSQLIADRSCRSTGRPLPQAMTIMRHELGTQGSHDVIAMSQILPRTVMDGWCEEPQHEPLRNRVRKPLTRLQITWCLMALNTTWASHTFDHTAVDFLRECVVMPYDHIWRRHVWQTTQKWYQWRRPIIMFVSNYWCVQYPDTSGGTNRNNLQKCRDFAEAVHVWKRVFQTDPFDSTLEDDRPCHAALSAIH